MGPHHELQPARDEGPGAPPTFSGYPIDDEGEWAAFREEYERSHRETWERYNAFVVDAGAPPLPDLEFIHESDVLNLSVYPSIADYPRSRPLASTWHRLESSVRETEEPFEVPESLATATARSCTCRSARSARPTSS